MPILLANRWDRFSYVLIMVLENKLKIYFPIDTMIELLKIE